MYIQEIMRKLNYFPYDRIIFEKYKYNMTYASYDMFLMFFVFIAFQKQKKSTKKNRKSVKRIWDRVINII